MNAGEQRLEQAYGKCSADLECLRGWMMQTLSADQIAVLVILLFELVAEVTPLDQLEATFPRLHDLITAPMPAATVATPRLLVVAGTDVERTDVEKEHTHNERKTK